jgi:hypothetical protein
MTGIIIFFPETLVLLNTPNYLLCLQYRFVGLNAHLLNVERRGRKHCSRQKKEEDSNFVKVEQKGQKNENLKQTEIATIFLN